MGSTVHCDSPQMPVGANGEWHRHLEYTLLDPASDGVYLLALTLHSSNPTIAPSDVFYIDVYVL